MKTILYGFFFVAFSLVACNPPSHKQSTNTKRDSGAGAANTSNKKTSDSVKENLPKQYETLKNTIDFKATGNEPFWLLEIDFDKFMHFKTLNGFEITTPVPEATKAADANAMRYKALTEQGELIVQIAKRECINDMSGKKSNYSVSIDVKNNSDKDYTSYKGCGEYFADYRINDIWVLESINNKPVDKVNFTKEFLRLEINLVQKKAFGSGGCNSFTGDAEVMGKKIKFGNLAVTTMACLDMKFENNYIKGLSNHTIPYFITPGKLQMQFNSDSVFVYKKVD